MSKKLFRQLCRHRAIPNPLYRSRIINKQLLNLLRPYRTILLYLPLPGEVDIWPLLIKLRRMGKEIAVPAMVGRNGMKMVKFKFPVVKQKLIPEPATSNPFLKRVEVAVIPVIGVDRRGGRVGFGRGVYDRFFNSLPYRPKLIFTQLAPCFCRRAITDGWDVKGDFYSSFKLLKKRSWNGGLYLNGGDICRSGGVYYRKCDSEQTALKTGGAGRRSDSKGLRNAGQKSETGGGAGD